MSGIKIKPNPAGNLRRHSTGCMKYKQRGQSMVETVISLIVLVPLAIGIALLGQFTHIGHEVQMAARQAAWDASASPKLAHTDLPSKIAEQSALRSRSFGDAGVPISSDADAPDEFHDPMLTTVSGHQLLKPQDLALTVYTQEGAPSILDKVIGALGGAAEKVHLGGSLPPNDKGLVTAEVHASTRQILGRDGQILAFLGPIASEQLDFGARTVLLVDPWDAAGGGELDGGKSGGPYYNRTVRAVIRPMVPSTWFADKVKPITDVLTNIVGWIPLIGPGLSGFEFGRTAPDVVPDDKLVPYKDVH